MIHDQLLNRISRRVQECEICYNSQITYLYHFAITQDNLVRIKSLRVSGLVCRDVSNFVNNPCALYILRGDQYPKYIQGRWKTCTGIRTEQQFYRGGNKANDIGNLLDIFNTLSF